MYDEKSEMESNRKARKDPERDSEVCFDVC